MKLIKLSFATATRSVGAATRSVAAIVCLFVSAFAHAAAIPKFNQFLSQTKSGTADFEQTVYDKAQRVTQTAKGRFVFARPGKFRWTYEKPKQLIVGDGAKVWIFDEDLAQVTVRKLGNALSTTPAALLTGDANVQNLFALSEQGAVDGIDWLEAKPKQSDTGFERVRIGFSGDQLAAMELFDQFGTRTVLKFVNVKRNAAVEAGQFQFTPPKGVDVISD
jgi:outer membrane lipoprotein carrier protein